MLDSEQTIIPTWPDFLQDVDIVKVRFALDFISDCTLQPADFLSLGRILKLSGRQLLDGDDAVAMGQWEALFQPPLSSDPVALRKYQKAAPAFVMTMPVEQPTAFDVGDTLNCEVLFIGTGIPLIHVFLRSMIHLGRLGLVRGQGQFDVTEVYSVGMGEDPLVWRQGDPVASLLCPVLPMAWILKDCRLTEKMTLHFTTPTRLMVDGKPLRKPKFRQVFPFMLRRVTSMLYAHSGIEQHDDISSLVDLARQVEACEAKLEWRDWRHVGKQDIAVGGFVGEMALGCQGLEEIFWVLAAASLMGVGKGATYGAGRVNLAA